jgi:hypothetical protein
MRPLCPCKPRVHRRYARVSAFVSATPTSPASHLDNKIFAARTSVSRRFCSKLIPATLKLYFGSRC